MYLRPAWRLSRSNVLTRAGRAGTGLRRIDHGPKVELQPQRDSSAAADKVLPGHAIHTVVLWTRPKWADHGGRGTDLRDIGKTFSTMGSQRNGLQKERFILSVDVGTTSIRCHVYDKEAKIRGSCTAEVLISSFCFWRDVSQLQHPLTTYSIHKLFIFICLILFILCPGCSLVSRGNICGDGPRCTMDRVCRCGQGSCARYSCAS